MEEWRDVEGYEGLYQVSNEGRVRSFRKRGTHEICESPFVMKTPISNPTGYAICGLYKDGKRKNALVHRLVAGAFVLNPNNKPQVNHKNGIRSDNRACNLEWVTASENVKHGFDHNGRLPPRLGAHAPCPYRPLSDDQVRFVRASDLMGVELAKMFGVSPQAICNIRKRKSYKDVV